MTIKKCRRCGAKYKVENTEIKLNINHKDIEAIEDIFFCENTKEQYEKIKPCLNKIWKQLCDEEKRKKLVEYSIKSWEEKIK